MGALREDDHLPFPVPSRSFAISQEWRDLTFMHWKVDPKRLEQHLPDGLEIDFFDGEAYVGVIPFMMKNVHPKGLVPLRRQRRTSRGVFPHTGCKEFGDLSVRKSSLWACLPICKSQSETA